MTFSPAQAPSRPRTVRPARRGTFLVAAVAFAGLCLAIWPPHALQYDLRVYVVAARAFLHGQDIYTAHHAFPNDMLLGFTYPPFAALVFAPIAVPGTEIGRAVMTLANAATLLAIGLITTRALRPGWSKARVMAVGLAVGAAGLALEPVRSTFALGQVNLFLLALVLVDLLRYVPSRGRGVLVGIATGIKLTPGIFIVYLLVARRYREAMVASVATGATILVGALAMPDGSRQFWGHYLLDPSRPGATHFVSNQAWRGVFARIAGGVDGIGPAWIVAVGITLAIGYAAVRRACAQGDLLGSILLAAVVGLLVSPISWTGHWVWALPIGTLLWFRTARANGPRRTILGALAALWTITVTIGLPWHAPHLGDREYTHHGFQLFLGNSYAVCAALTLLLAATQAVNSDARTR